MTCQYILKSGLNGHNSLRGSISKNLFNTEMNEQSV